MNHNKIHVDHYEYDPKKDFLGQGSFGKVYKGSNTKTNEIVAIKILDMKLFHDPFMIQSLQSEIKIMHKLTSQNVVKLIDVFEVKSHNQTYMIIEYCAEGDLRKFLKKHNGHLKEELAIEVLTQLMRGFKELIANNYIHRDIKPENALVKGNLYKVADFGFATKVDLSGRHLIRECVGTPLYMAPQLIQQHSYTAKSDIWSIGMMYYEMLFGKTAWSCRDQHSFLHNIQTIPLKFPYDKPISQNSKDFIKRCLVVSEQSRIGWDEIFKHPLLSQSGHKYHIFFIMRNSPPVQHTHALDEKSKVLLRRLQSVAHQYNLNPLDIFKQFDQDHNNVLDPLELTLLLRALNPKITGSESQHLYLSLCGSNKQLDFTEFQKIFCEMDFCDLNDRAQIEHILTDLKEIIKANKFSLSKLFSNCTENRDGHLDLKQFSVLLRQLAPGLKDDEIAEVFNKFDFNHDGNISFDEFRVAIGKGIEKSQENPVLERAKKVRDNMRQLFKTYHVDLNQVFNKFDKRHESHLDKEECYKLFKIVDENITQREAMALFSLFDQDGDGYITFNEFKSQLEV